MSKPIEKEKKFNDYISKDQSFAGEVVIDPSLAVSEFEIIDNNLRPDKSKLGIVDFEVGDIVIFHSYKMGVDVGHTGIVAKDVDEQGRETGELILVDAVNTGVRKIKLAQIFNPKTKYGSIDSVIRFQDENLKDQLSNFSITAEIAGGEYSIRKILKIPFQVMRAGAHTTMKGAEFRERKLNKYSRKIERRKFVRLLREEDAITKGIKKIEEIENYKKQFLPDRVRIERIERLKDELSKKPPEAERERLERTIESLSKEVKNGKLSKEKNRIAKAAKELKERRDDLRRQIDKGVTGKNKYKLEAGVKRFQEDYKKLKDKYEIIYEKEDATKNKIDKEKLDKLKNRQEILLKEIADFRRKNGVLVGSSQERKIKKTRLKVYCSHLTWVILQRAFESINEGKIPPEISDTPGSVNPLGLLEKFREIEKDPNREDKLKENKERKVKQDGYDLEIKKIFDSVELLKKEMPALQKKFREELLKVKDGNYNEVEKLILAEIEKIGKSKIDPQKTAYQNFNEIIREPLEKELRDMKKELLLDCIKNNSEKKFTDTLKKLTKLESELASLTSEFGLDESMKSDVRDLKAFKNDLPKTSVNGYEMSKADNSANFLAQLLMGCGLQKSDKLIKDCNVNRLINAIEGKSGNLPQEQADRLLTFFRFFNQDNVGHIGVADIEANFSDIGINFSENPGCKQQQTVSFKTSDSGAKIAVIDTYHDFVFTDKGAADKIVANGILTNKVEINLDSGEVKIREKELVYELSDPKDLQSKIIFKSIDFAQPRELSQAKRDWLKKVEIAQKNQQTAIAEIQPEGMGR